MTKAIWLGESVNGESLYIAETDNSNEPVNSKWMQKAPTNLTFTNI